MTHWRWLWWPRAAQVHIALLAGLVAWAAFQCFGPARSQGIAAVTYDMMQRHRLWASAPDPRLLIVDVDERSLADLSAEFGRWPWSRDTLATVLQQAQKEGAAAVVFDILFADPDRVRPGGDRALDAAVRAGTLSFFEVVRLPARSDAQSSLTLDHLPGLGIAPGTPSAHASTHASTPAPKIALIAPFMQSMVEGGRIGTNTVELDADGKLRRFAWAEALQGWRVVSIPHAVARALGAAAPDVATEPLLTVWRRGPDAYPRVPFSVLLACAERNRAAGCPALAGKVLIVGVTASSLHDIMSSPLAINHAGVDILATLVDNALHQRWYREIAPPVRFALALAALFIGWRATRKRAASATQIALIALPVCLVAIGYASLHTEWVYLDLMLPAGVALTFLSIVKLHDTLRRHVFGLRDAPRPGTEALAVGTAARHAEQLERLVFDVAARTGLQASGGVNSAGAWGEGDSCWVLWNLDAATVRTVTAQLAAGAPAAWAVPFGVGVDAQHDLHRALAQRRHGMSSGARPTPALPSSARTEGV